MSCDKRATCSIVTMMWGRINSWLWRRKPVTMLPGMARISFADGRSAKTVHVEARFSPTGRVVSGKRTLQRGLCTFPWTQGETKVDIRVTTDGAEGTLSIIRGESDRAEPLTLRPVPAPASESAEKEESDVEEENATREQTRASGGPKSGTFESDRTSAAEKEKVRANGGNTARRASQSGELAR